jgi:hypothetical protein
MTGTRESCGVTRLCAAATLSRSCLNNISNRDFIQSSTLTWMVWHSCGSGVRTVKSSLLQSCRIRRSMRNEFVPYLPSQSSFSQAKVNSQLEWRWRCPAAGGIGFRHSGADSTTRARERALIGYMCKYALVCLVTVDIVRLPPLSPVFLLQNP